MLAENPIFAIFHSESSASTFLEEANAGAYLVKWNDEEVEVLHEKIKQRLTPFISASNPNWHPDLTRLEPYSSRESARALFRAIDTVLQK